VNLNSDNIFLIEMIKNRWLEEIPHSEKRIRNFNSRGQFSIIKDYKLKKDFYDELRYFYQKGDVFNTSPNEFFV
jgi:hypothetical protein